VIFARTLMALITFWLVGWEARRRSGSWRIAALVTTPACIITLNNLIVRPQNWSWLPFMAFYILLSRFADLQLHKRWLLGLPVIMVFWVNAHGAFILGLAMVGIFLLGETLRTLLKQPGQLPMRSIGSLAGISLLTGLATVVSPRFDDG
jgi:hypothetical protein